MNVIIITVYENIFNLPETEATRKIVFILIGNLSNWATTALIASFGINASADRLYKLLFLINIFPFKCTPGSSFRFAHSNFATNPKPLFNLE